MKIRKSALLGATVSLGVTALLSGCGQTSSNTQNTSTPSQSGTSSSAVQSIKDAVAKMEQPQTNWTGPTTGPTAAKGKFIVYLSGDAQNNLSRNYGIFMQQATQKIGWKFKVINCTGDATSWLNGLNEAIALKPDGIAMFADAATLQGPINEAVSQGIVVIGLHAAGEPGPQPSLHMFTNIESSPEQIGKAEADYAIAHSDGQGHVVILTHNEYAVAKVKSTATKQEIQSVSTMKLMSYANVPAANPSSHIPQLMTSWVQQYGLPLWVTTVGDDDYDFAVPALRSMGVDPTQVHLIGSDGTPGAYARIRDGNQYQVATIPEPVELQAWQVVDEFNRAFHKDPASNFIDPAHIVTHDNVNTEGGDKNMFFPSNNYKQHYEKIWGVQ